jgi:hypothetical protein
MPYSLGLKSKAQIWAVPTGLQKKSKEKNKKKLC